MHDLDGDSDPDIMFGHARDETIAYSLTTSNGKDLTDGHKNSDVWRLQPEGKIRRRSRETRGDLRSKVAPGAWWARACFWE